jgi:excisionase family DNA binding protein
MGADLLTIKEVAQLLHRSIPQLNKDKKLGRIPFIKLGYSVRFRPEDIERIAREGFGSGGSK